MKRIIPILFVLCAAFVVAQSNYVIDVTATMDTPVGGDVDGCQLYVDGVLAQYLDEDGQPALAPCDEPVSYPGLLPSLGQYAFSYQIHGPGGVQESPVVLVSMIPPPGEPTDPPRIEITCSDEGGDLVQCPFAVTININP